MFINKNVMFRYQILDECFRDTREYYTFDLLKNTLQNRLGDDSISDRQLRNDIASIRSKLPSHVFLETIQYNGNSYYYRYSNTSFSLLKGSLSNDDREDIISVIELLSRFKGVAGNSWVEEIIAKLEFRFNLKESRADIISFDNNEQLKGIEYLSKIIDAAINYIPLKIKYESFGGNQLSFTFHTYYIKQYNNRWYAIGLSRKKTNSGIYTIALDRIVSLKEHKTTFTHNNDIDFSKYFDDVIGVTKTNREIETIKLRFDERRFPYVVTKPIHKSQKVIDKENCIITLQLIPNKEFYSKIFEFGPHVEVLEPESIREHFRQEYEKCLKQYDKKE